MTSCESLSRCCICGALRSDHYDIVDGVVGRRINGVRHTFIDALTGTGSMTNVLHGVPPESAYIQRLRAELVEIQARVKRDTALLHAQMQAVDVGYLLLSGSLARLSQALTDAATTLAKDTP